MPKIYGYCRISTPKQNIERQERNIRAAYPDAVIIKEVYTGTKTQGRKAFEQLLRKVQAGDTIVFDSVSRMSRDAADGTQIYMDLYENGVILVFLKEPYINTETYRQDMSREIPMTGDDVDCILSGVNIYLKQLAAKQIKIAFEQSEKEVADLRRRTSEGLLTAKLNGKRVGTPKGTVLGSAKESKTKKMIMRNARTFGGSLTDKECAKLAGVCLKTYYKYKAQLRAEPEK
jgi:DNA invertase Pin-like site-specific DNA recombinase